LLNGSLIKFADRLTAYAGRNGAGRGT